MRSGLLVKFLYCGLSTILLQWIPNVEALSDVMIREFQDCKDENNVTESDLELMKQKEIPESRDARCFLACLMDRVDLMNGSRLNVAGAKGMIAQIEDISEETRDKLSQAVDDCEATLQYPEEDEDFCENGVMIATCISDKAIEKGVTAPE